jgi:peptide/nickel transport system permease protein
VARTLIRRVLRRLGVAILLVLIVSSSALVLARLAPGDTTDAFDARTPEQIAEDRRRLGLDLPLHQVYGQWLGRLVRLDLGTSLKYHRPVSELVAERSANTALLATTALALATLVGLPLGVFTASRRRGLVPPLVRAASVTALSAPPLLTSLALVLMAARTGWLPIGGIGTVWHLVIPAIALALPAMGTLERLQAGAMTETLHERFMLAAVARGVPDRSLVWRHAFRASLAPVLGVYAIIVASLFSGSFAVEIVTSWPGLGRLMFDALIARDIHLVAGCAVAGSCFLAVGSLAADAALAWADPRAGEPS